MKTVQQLLDSWWSNRRIVISEFAGSIHAETRKAFDEITEFVTTFNATRPEAEHVKIPDDAVERIREIAMLDQGYEAASPKDWFEKGSRES